MTTAKTETARPTVAEVVRKMLYPSPLMHWMEGLTQAERIGRIKKSKYSVLRYAIRQFLVTQISTQTDLYAAGKVTVVPMDDEVEIAYMYRESHDDDCVLQEQRTVTVTYPDWLLDFLDDDENFALMLPECEEKVGEVIQRIYEWCLGHPPYNLLVEKT